LRPAEFDATLFDIPLLKGNMMKKLIRSTLAVAALLTASTAAFGQTAPAAKQASDCVAPQPDIKGRLNWFLGMAPTDDLLTTWCKLQTLQGSITFNVRFPYTNASKSWETSFNGVTMPASRIVEIVQSTLPTKSTALKTEDDQAFAKVLLNVVQLRAKSANDKTVLDFAPEHPSANELALWEPIVLRVKPILLAGQQFKLLIKLKPNVGLLSLGLQKKATDVKLQGWRGRLTLGTFFSGDCSDAIPECKGLPDTVTFHAPWIMDAMELSTTGESMTASALQIADQLLKTNASIAPAISPLKSFNLKTGQGTFSLSDPYSTVTYTAKGAPSGTQEITILYKVSDGQYSVTKQLDGEAAKFRASVSQKPKEQPPVPESLGRL
jgi:hypothetical protein